MSNLFRRFVNDSGVTAVEYGLVAGLIAVVIIGAVTSLGTKVQSKFQSVADALTSRHPQANGPRPRASRPKLVHCARRGGVDS